jgi:CheY-like chemotaxis protein
MSRPLILVVDDEESNRQVCREALEYQGYEVVVAAGTCEAVEILSTREVDAIVCDIQMPHNGKRLHEFLLARFPELAGRFIFVTGNAAKKAEVEREARTTPCLLKPFSISTLMEAMRAALR